MPLNPKPHTFYPVERCDATMLPKEQMPVPKIFYTIGYRNLDSINIFYEAIAFLAGCYNRAANNGANRYHYLLGNNGG